MSTKAGRFPGGGGIFRRAGALWLALLVFAPILLALPGCSGCNKDPAALKAEAEKAEAERKKKEAEKPKPDFEQARLGTIPSSQMSLTNYCKPGHWTNAVLAEVRAAGVDLTQGFSVGRPEPLGVYLTSQDGGK